MTEVVVQIKAQDTGDVLHLSNALDAFTKWVMETNGANDSADPPHIMMMTDHTIGAQNRRLVFQDRRQAASFLMFWRQERHRSRYGERPSLSA